MNTANENSRTKSPGHRFNLTAFWSDARSHRQTSIRGSKRKAYAAMQGSRESERMSVPDAQLLGLALLTLRAAYGWRSPSGWFTEREGCFLSHVQCCQTHWQVSLRMFKPEGLVSCSSGVPSESECSPGNPASRPIPVRSRTLSGSVQAINPLAAHLLRHASDGTPVGSAIGIRERMRTFPQERPLRVHSWAACPDPDGVLRNLWA